MGNNVGYVRVAGVVAFATLAMVGAARADWAPRCLPEWNSVLGRCTDSGWVPHVRAGTGDASEPPPPVFDFPNGLEVAGDGSWVDFGYAPTGTVQVLNATIKAWKLPQPAQADMNNSSNMNSATWNPTNTGSGALIGSVTGVQTISDVATALRSQAADLEAHARKLRDAADVLEKAE